MQEGINFSVIIPTYNRARILPKTIESVLAQTYKDFEIIVIDDGSTDNTKETVEPYLHLPNFRYFFKENGGSASARNLGINNARGNYIAFLDSDDSWYPEKLYEVIKAIKEHPDAGLFYSDVCIVNENDEFLWINHCPHIVGDGYSKILKQCFILTTSTVVKRECLDNCGLFYEFLLGAQDWDLWIRITKNYKIVHISKVLVKWRYQSRNLLARMGPEFIEYLRIIMQRVISSDPRINKREILANFHYISGKYYIENLQLKEANREFLNSIKLNPFFFKSYIYYFISKDIKIIEKIPKSLKKKLSFHLLNLTSLR